MEERREQEEGISLLDILYRVKKHIVFIIISIVACVGAMGIYSVAIQKPQYVATSSVIMNASSDSNLSGTAGLNYSLSIIETYSEFIQSKTVRTRALEIAELPKNTEYTISTKNSGTLIVHITITSYDSNVSVKLANAFIEAGTDVINTNPEGSMKSLKLASPSILDEATNASTSRNLFRNCVIGAAIGVVIACAYVFIRMLIDNTYTKPEQIEKELDLPVLAVTPFIDFNELDEKGNPVKKNKK